MTDSNFDWVIRETIETSVRGPIMQFARESTQETAHVADPDPTFDGLDIEWDHDEIWENWIPEQHSIGAVHDDGSFDQVMLLRAPLVSP